ncbi:mpv17-like protein [Eurosta solidaginis]|uniref:mpv17-like protein n=1 Tax=Eurosta solidaginis TaxID=178769 RepID=UPI0035316647
MPTSLQSLFYEGVRVAGIMGAGDVICQTWVDKRKINNIDVGRTLRFASVGLFYVGPALKIWYGTLDKIVNKADPPFKRGLKKMALDQFAFAPGFVASLIGIFGLMNGDSTKTVQKRLKKDYLDILIKNYMLWPPAQMINFSLVPIQYQVFFAQVVAVIWNTYLSMALNDDKK